MSRALDDLSEKIRPKAFEFVARCAEAGVHVMFVDTLRTREEQAENIRKGVSWTKNSRHLPDAQGKSNAFDVVPYSVFQLHGPDKVQWDANDPAWNVMGEIGEKLGLVWGGRWKQKDLGHFEEPRQ